MSAPALLGGVDRAAFAVALVARLRSGGVVVSASGPAGFVAALDVATPRSRTELYWAARLTLINRADDLSAFDAVFAGAVPGLDPVARKSALNGLPALPTSLPDPAAAPPGHGRPLPWATRTAVRADQRADGAKTEVESPDPLPSRLTARADEAFEAFDEADLRRTMRDSRRTGFQAVRLARTRRRRRPRRIVLLCDVSRSMQPYVGVYLHLMRATAMRRTTLRPEVFAFSTSLTRLTPVLSHHSTAAALARERGRQRPLRRYTSGPEPGRYAVRAARQCAAGGRRRNRLRRLGCRQPRVDGTRDAAAAAPGRVRGMAQSARGG